MDIAKIKKSLLGVNGWKQNWNPNGLQVLEMTESESGLWYNDIHSMMTYDNILSLVEDNSEFVYPSFDPAKADYVVGNVVSDGSKLYERMAVSLTAQPLNSVTYWKEYNYETAWLKSKTEGCIGDVISDWKALRAESMGARNLLGNGKLFTGPIIGGDYVKTGSVVGHYCAIPYSKGLATTLTRVSTNFTVAEPIEFKLFKFGNLYPIETYTVNHTTPNQEEWHDINIQLDSDSRYYLVYDENSLTGKPITSYRGGTWRMGKHISVSGFKANQGFNETWDIDHNSFNVESNFGLNYEFNVVCDPTDLIIEQASLFSHALYYRMGVNMLNQMAFNAGMKISRNTKNMEWSKNEILFAVEGNPDGHRNGLLFEYQKRLRALNIDLSGMDSLCLGCAKRKVRRRVI